MKSIYTALKGKGLGNLLRRGTRIAGRYGLTPKKMDRALSQFSTVLERFQCGATWPITTVALERNARIISKYWDQNIEFGERNLPLGFFDASKLPTFDRYPVVQQIQQTMWALTKKLETTPDVPSPRRASVRVYDTWQALVARVSLNLHTVITRL